MAYDRPTRISHTFPASAALTGNTTFSLKGPPGKKGRLQVFGCFVSTTTAGATTTPYIQLGVSGTLGQYASADVGALTAPEPFICPDSSIVKETNSTAPKEIPADTEILLTCVAATGSGAAGVVVPFAVIDWY